jgi:hypothetical protein
MHPHRLIIACASLLLAAASCKKSPPPSGSAEGATKARPSADALPSPSRDAARPSAQDAGPAGADRPDETDPGAPVPSAFVKFEDLLLPLVREPRSEARSAKTCRMIEELRIASLAVQRSMPKGVDEAAWEAASNEMSGAFEGMGATCTDKPPNDSPDLAVIHKSYARMLELMPE